MLWAEPAGYQLRRTARQRPRPSTRGLAPPVIPKWPGLAAWDLYVPTREHTGLIQNPAARAPSPVAQFCHQAQLCAQGPEERWMLAYWAPVWEVPGSWGMHSTAWSQLSRWNRVHALGGQQRLKNKGPRASPTRAIMCAEALFGPHCPVRDAGGARGRWAVVNRSPPAHSKWLPRPTRFAEQLLWVTRAVAMGYRTEEAGACVGWRERAGCWAEAHGGGGWAIKKAQVRAANPRVMPRRTCRHRQHLHFCLA